MRDLFPGYYRPTNEEFSRMWHEGIFAFDANVLLNIYRYSAQTREELFDIFDHLKDRTWIPHQAMLEYHENRQDVIAEQDVICGEIDTALKDVSDRITKKYSRGHPFANTILLNGILQEATEKIKSTLSEARARHPNLLESDYLLERVTELFSGRVGCEYSPAQLERLYGIIAQRFRLQIPPGYRDKKRKKDGNNQYGDGVLWFQLIDYAKTQGKPIILTTDDTKDDWWRIEEGKTIGPRPELIREMRKDAGVPFYMYHADRFMEYAKDYLGLRVKQEAIDEVRDVVQQDEDSYQRSLASSTLASGVRAALLNAGAVEDIIDAQAGLQAVGVAAEQIAASVAFDPIARGVGQQMADLSGALGALDFAGSRQLADAFGPAGELAREVARQGAALSNMARAVDVEAMSRAAQSISAVMRSVDLGAMRQAAEAAASLRRVSDAFATISLLGYPMASQQKTDSEDEETS